MHYTRHRWLYRQCKESLNNISDRPSNIYSDILQWVAGNRVKGSYVYERDYA